MQSTLLSHERSHQVTGPTCHSKGITGYGSTESGICFVGISPGTDEMRSKRPLTGPNGRLLDAILDSVGIKREDCYATNLVCAQRGLSVEDCSQRFAQEIELVNPRLIVPLGAEATLHLTGKNIGKVRGIPIHDAKHNRYIMATNHPIAIVHNNLVVYDIVRDLAKLRDVLGWPNDGSIKEVRYNVVASHEEAQAMMDSLPNGEPVAIDIETTSHEDEEKDVFTDRILCIAFTYPKAGGDWTTVVPAQFLTGLNWRTIGPLWTFHFGIFDVVGIRREYGVWLTINHDTGLVDYCIDERAGKEAKQSIHSLGRVGGEYVGLEFWKSDVDRKHLEREPITKVYKYNATDAAGTLRVLHKRLPALHQDDMAQVYENILLPAANCFAEISYEGVRIDQQRFEEIKQDWIPRYINGERRLQREAEHLGFTGTNLNSSQQLGRFLYGVLGLPCLGYTAAGKPSTKEEFIEQLDHPFVDKLLRHKKLGKALSTYVLGIEDDIKSDGLIHPEPLLHGTATGRLSYHNPPIQTIPKHFENEEDRDLIVLREIFIPKDTHTHTFIAADYSQLEIWVAQWLSQDQQLLEDLQSGDYHGMVCTNVLGYDKSVIDKDLWTYHRTRAKRVTFGVFYGIGAQGLSHRKTGINSTVEEAAQYIKYYFDRYPSYTRFYREQIRLAREEGYIISPFGRKRRFPLVLDNRADRQAVNFPVQSTASDVCLLSLIELHKTLKQYDSRVVWSVHDELLFEVSRRYFNTVATLIHDTMTKPKLPDMPTLPVELTTGDHLHHMQEVTL